MITSPLTPLSLSLSLQSLRGDHLSYLFQPQFAGGRTFCASMLDTMLYQSHFKPYIVDLVRQLLGCLQVNDSAYLWKVLMSLLMERYCRLSLSLSLSLSQLEIGEELSQLQTYDRLFQKVVTVHHCVPLGLYRTVPLPSCPVFQVHNTSPNICSLSLSLSLSLTLSPHRSTTRSEWLWGQRPATWPT